jgi:hypothetical protein
MYDNLMSEVNSMKDSWGYDTLGALEFILDNIDEYPSVVRAELRRFMSDGARMFASPTP